jgi:RND family efflux transporter MFP subunit
MDAITTGMEPMDPDHEVLDPYVEPREEAGGQGDATRYTAGTGRSLLRVALVIAIALVAGFFLVHRNRSAADARLAEEAKQAASEEPVVEAVKVQRAAAAQSLILPGATAAWDEATIYGRVNGYVAKWMVDIGDQVKAGQTLATINTPELDAELLAARAKLNAAIAQVAVKSARAQFATTSYQRWRDSPKGVVSDQEREDKQAAKAEADAELTSAHAQVALQQADVDRLTAMTRFKEVKAPFDGSVAERQVDTGDLVTAGSTANTKLLFRVVQDDPIRVFVSAPQNVAADLMKPGVEADVILGDASGQRIVGKVARTAGAIDPRSRTLRVEIDLANPGHKVVPGMYVQVEFKLSSGNAIQVPAAALLFRSDGPYVAVIGADGAVAFRKVTIARDDGTTVTIGSGLSDGDDVALNISSQIVSGQRVKVRRTGGGALQKAADAK